MWSNNNIFFKFKIMFISSRNLNAASLFDHSFEGESTKFTEKTKNSKSYNYPIIDAHVVEPGFSECLRPDRRIARPVLETCEPGALIEIFTLR